MSAGSPPQLGLAYLTSQYPATSHTFISREVAAIRAMGVRVDTFSIRSPSSAEMEDQVSRAEALTTFTVLRQPASAFLSSHFATLLRNPAAYVRIFICALNHRAPGIRGLALALAHFAEAIMLANELRRRGTTHLHNHFANSAATVGYLATRLMGIRWSFTMHGISETDYPAGLLLGRKIEAAKFVACVSYFGRAQAMRLVQPMFWKKLHVVRCGLPLDQLHPDLGHARNNVRLVCVGRLSPEKGQAGLLEAFSSVAQDDHTIELVMVGDGPESDALREQSRHLRLGDRVKFVGRLCENDTLNEIAQADILVLPSFMEGLPVVLIEAMAMGTAVIASRVAGIPELVRDRQTGLLFTPSDWSELAQCIRELAGNPRLREQFASAGRLRVASEFDSSKSADRLIQLYSDVSDLSQH